MAAAMGLPEGIAVCVGNVDAHVTAPAAGAAGAGQMVAIMGTSTCHVLNGAELREIHGMCGVVDGGIVPGLCGLRGRPERRRRHLRLVRRPRRAPAGAPRAPARPGRERPRAAHRRSALEQPVGAHGLVALDWWNGNRVVLVDHDLSGLIVGLTLQTRARRDLPGARRVHGVRGPADHRVVRAPTACRWTSFIVAGGLLKNPLVMQIYADVLQSADPRGALGSRRPRSARRCTRRWPPECYPDIVAAALGMARLERDVWLPDPADRADAYDRALRRCTVDLHDHFGARPRR